ncbi:hypothetical protein LCGC14_1300150 [marine sediment metagenome]|uniref:Uncharacterized protein n=1 Tax=marine sediment metagenome TaxID=412755 RepID=A0A0F9LAH7_9ZZZZ
MKEDVKPAIGIFCCGIVLGCCITLVIGGVLSSITGRPCNHGDSKVDLTFARTSTGTLMAWTNGLERNWKQTCYPENSNYAAVCEVFEPYMAYATTLSHNRGRQATFCEKCLPHEEAIQCDALQ